jgi:hypothetical protein
MQGYKLEVQELLEMYFSTKDLELRFDKYNTF